MRLGCQQRGVQVGGLSAITRRAVPALHRYLDRGKQKYLSGSDLNSATRTTISKRFPSYTSGMAENPRGRNPRALKAACYAERSYDLIAERVGRISQGAVSRKPRLVAIRRVFRMKLISDGVVVDGSTPGLSRRRCCVETGPVAL